MTGRWLIAVACIAGCGRIDFDPLADAPVAVTMSIGGNTNDGATTMADTYIAECNPTFEFGGSDHVHVSDGSPCPMSGRVVALFRFDVSSVPASARVTSATFRIWTHGGTTLVATHELHRVLESWQEGASSDNGALGPPNWTQRLPGVLWTTAGCGDGSCDPAVIGSFVSIAAPAQVLEAPVDVNVVQGWVDGSSENNGFAIKAPGATVSSALGTRDGVDGQRPELVLSYLP